MSYMKNTLGENPLLSGTVGTSTGMVIYDDTTGITPGSSVWVTGTSPGGTITITEHAADVPFLTTKTIKRSTLQAQCKMHRRTIEAYGAGDARDIVKGRLVKDLLAQLMESGLVKITSTVSKAGAVTFTATVDVNETP